MKFKKTFFVTVFIFVLYFLICLIGKGNFNVKGIVISAEAVSHCYQLEQKYYNIFGKQIRFNKDFNYCRLYGKALEGDTSAIRKFVLNDYFNDGGMYVHGVYIIRMIDRIGDKTFVEALENNGLSGSHKIRLYSYISAGVDIYNWYFTGNDANEYSSVDNFWNKHPEIKRISYTEE